MGKGTITSGGADGLYTLSLDYGQAIKDQRIADTIAQQASTTAEIATARAAYDAKVAEEEAQKAIVNDTIEAYATAFRELQQAQASVTSAMNTVQGLLTGPVPPDPLILAAANAALSAANAALSNAESALANAQDDYTEAAADLVPFKAEAGKLRAPLLMLEAKYAQLVKDMSRWASLVVTETKQVWCTDFTEDASGVVATIEIPGEAKLMVIAPGGAAHNPATDGLLTAREVQSPEQVFWNAAVLPGWQKWKPTYRRGTITGLDVENDTANVTLEGTDVSSAQNLAINQSAQLTAIPVEYMECNAEAFEVGDRCVVKFTGQDWTSPKVIGFCDNPKPCVIFPEFLYLKISSVDEVFEAGPTRAWFTSVIMDPLYGCGLKYTAYSANRATWPTMRMAFQIDPWELGDGFMPAGDWTGLTVNGPPVAVSLWEDTYNWDGALSNAASGAQGKYLDAFYQSVPGENIATLSIDVTLKDILSGTFPGSYGFPGCIEYNHQTANYFSSVDIPRTSVVPLQRVDTWISSMGKMPAISATREGRNRTYTLEACVRTPSVALKYVLDVP